MARSNKGDSISQQLDFRISGLEYAIDESMPVLVGALVHHLAKAGLLDLAAFERDLRSEISDQVSEDSTGVAFARLAKLAAAYRRDGCSGARYEPLLELTLPTDDSPLS